MSGVPQSQTTGSAEHNCTKTINSIQVNLFGLINSYEKSNSGDLANRLRQVESGLETLRNAIQAIPDIDEEQSVQCERIASLRRRIALKDELISSFSHAGKEFTDNVNPEGGDEAEDDDGTSKTEQDLMAETEAASTSDQDSRNEEKVVCPNCGSVILLAGVGVLVRGHVVGLPKPQQRKGAIEVEREELSDWWSVRDHLQFENVGFTHAVDGVKYLTCADCELGPLGYVHPENKLNLVSVHRVAYK